MSHCITYIFSFVSFVTHNTNKEISTSIFLDYWLHFLKLWDVFFLEIFHKNMGGKYFERTMIDLGIISAEFEILFLS